MFIPELSLFFLHVPKMGGTSISKIFNRSANGLHDTEKTLCRHQNLQQCHKFCTRKGLQYPKIAFILLRNRFEQMHSAWRWYFRYKKERLNCYTNIFKIEDYSFNKYLNNIKLIHSCSSLSDIDLIQNGNFIVDKKGYLVADYRNIAKLNWWTNNDPNVIELKLSNINEDFNKKISPLINFNYIDVPHLNKNKTIPKAFITKKELDLIEEIYEDEIVKYSYQRPLLSE